jgi:Rrf2 family protein
VLSKKTIYALNALQYLARQPSGRPVLISEIAEKESIPQKFLELILLELKKDGILDSKKGKGGGYLLARPSDTISLGQIIRKLDGPLALRPCVSQTSYKRCEECHDEKTCGLRVVMKEVRDRTAEILDRTTLAQVNNLVQLAIASKTEIVDYSI